MILLVDCTPLSCGGGVQVAIAFLVNLHKTSDVTWRAVVPEALRPLFPLELRSDPRVIFLAKNSHVDRISLRNALRKIESAISPDVVFTVFGPAYFRARAPHVVGFALPHLIYGPIGQANAAQEPRELAAREFFAHGGFAGGRDRDRPQKTSRPAGI